MILNFTLNENDGLAFTEKYLRDSKSHQRLRERVRWGLPTVFLVIVGYQISIHRLSWTTVVIFATSAFAWWIFYPRRFDARVREQAKKQMGESSYAKSFGDYELTLLDEHLHSTSPTGASTYFWSSVDRVEMDSEYLYIFLAGPLGYPMRRSEIGEAAAQSAYEFVSARIAESRASAP